MTQGRTRWSRWGTLLPVVALVATACSSSASPSPTAAPVTQAPAASAAAPSTAASAPAASAPAASAPAASGGSSLLASFGKIGGTVTVVGSWTGSEQDSFLAMVKPFEDATGVQVQYTGSRDLQAQLSAGVKSGVLPDLAGLPTPGSMVEYEQAGALQDLGQMLDMNSYKAEVPQWAVDLGTADNKVVGVFIKMSVKGLIWYNPKVLTVSTPPATWDDLNKLYTDNKSKATNEWCVGLESGAASGWPGTDWIEDLVLRTAGPDVYKSWFQGKTKWTDPAIKNAWTMFGDVLKNAYGGSAYVNATNFANGGDKLFASPPGCLFHHQASFITGLGGFEKLKAGTDYNFFPFPDINAQFAGSLEGAGDLFGAFKNTPQSAALMKWLVSPEAQDIWVKRGGAISADKNVPTADYPDDQSRAAANLIVNAKNFVFDASDQMPAAMNDAFFKAVVSFAKDPTQLDSILGNLDQTQASAYGG